MKDILEIITLNDLNFGINFFFSNRYLFWGEKVLMYQL